MNEKINIVLADDHRLVLDGIDSMLKDSGYQIAGLFENGALCLEWLHSNHENVQILITDISMPVMDGITLCKEIKTRYAGISVLMLSMYSSAAAVDEALSAEADGFILKNAGKADFLTALHKIQNGGTYFSEQIMPLLYRQIVTERKKEEELALLTDREKEILDLISRELTSDEIAARLFLSKKR